MANSWENMQILITGGSSGIGATLADEFTRVGAHVGITGRNANRLAKAQAAIGARWTFAGDLSCREDRSALVAMVKDRGLGLDLLVNNAGFMLEPDLLNGGSGLERLDEEVGVNLIAPIELSVGLLPTLQQSSKGTIVMVTSGYALAPSNRAPTYSATKAGLRTFTKSFRRIAAANGVRIVEVIPPLVDTPATQHSVGKKLSAREVAAATLAGLESGRSEVLPGQVRFLPAMLRLFPDAIERIVAKS